MRRHGLRTLDTVRISIPVVSKEAVDAMTMAGSQGTCESGLVPFSEFLAVLLMASSPPLLLS